MGVSIPMMSPQWKDGLKNKGLESTHEVEAMLVRSFSFDGKEENGTLRSVSFRDRGSESKVISDGSHKIVLGKSLSFKNWEAEESKVETTAPFRSQDKEMKKEKPVPRPSLKTHDNFGALTLKPPVYFHEFVSPRPKSELDAAAVKLQKVYKSYRTRRNLADCAVVVEELWWKALDFAALKRSSVSFFSIEKPETAVSRWTRARTRVARVGKGLSKDEKAQKLALQHWLEAIDPRHRYGHNLHFYYDVWFHSESSQPFFYWLDVGDGKEVNLDKCPRCDLQRQWIAYLGPKERESFEVIVENGKLVYKESGLLVHTVGGYKWIFVLSTSRTLYVGQKKKGKFQHSSFLSGGATTAAGRLVAESGVLKAIWPYSGHYLPTEEHFREFLSFLEDNHVDLSNVKRCADDDDSSSFVAIDEEPQKEITKLPASTEEGASSNMFKVVKSVLENTHKVDDEVLNDKMSNVDASSFQSGKPLSCKWSTGTGPRIGCVRDYPSDLQFMALEKVNLSPRVLSTPFNSSGPIPSPRPSPKVRLSPRLSYMGLPSPRMAIPQSAK